MTCPQCGISPVEIDGMCFDCRIGDPSYVGGPPEAPTVEQECEAHGHAYYGDDGAPPKGRGRCYCGARIYPAGGPEPTEQSGE